MKLETVLVLVALPLGLCSECPSRDELEDMRNSPLISQVNPKLVALNWALLWPDVEWTECFSSAVIVRRNDESVFEIVDLDLKTLEVEVENSCEEVTFEVEVILSESGEDLRSFPSERSFKTYEGPKAKVIPEGSVDFVRYSTSAGGVINLTSVEVEVKFSEVVDNPSCNRVTNTVLLVKETEVEMWTEVTSAEFFRTLEHTIPDLSLCSSYEVALRLEGGEGTEDVLVPLDVVEKPDLPTLEQAHDTGFRFHPPKPIDLERVGREMTFTWTVAEGSSCLTGFKVILEDNIDLGLSKILPGDARSVSFAPDDLVGLSPCQKLTLSVSTLYEVSDDLSWESDAPATSLVFATDLDLETTFEVASLKTRSGKTSITLSWLKDEWPCVESDRFRARLCEVDLSDRSVAEVGSEGCHEADGVRRVSERLVANFIGLLPCTSYEVRATIC